ASDPTQLLVRAPEDSSSQPGADDRPPPEFGESVIAPPSAPFVMKQSKGGESVQRLVHRAPLPTQKASHLDAEGGTSCCLPLRLLDVRGRAEHVDCEPEHVAASRSRHELQKFRRRHWTHGSDDTDEIRWCSVTSESRVTWCAPRRGVSPRRPSSSRFEVPT